MTYGAAELHLRVAAPVSRAGWEQEAHEGEGDHLRVRVAIDCSVDDGLAALGVDHRQAHSRCWVFNHSFLEIFESGKGLTTYLDSELKTVNRNVNANASVDGISDADNLALHVHRR